MANRTSPYAAPSVGTVENLPTIRVANDLIIGQSPMKLPEGICIACSQDDSTGGPVTQDLVYVPLWMTLIVLGSCVVYVAFPFALIAYIFVRKRLKVTYHMCKSCRSSRRRKVALALFGGAAVLGSTLVAYDLMPAKVWLIPIGVAALVVGFFVAANKTRDPLRVGWKNSEFFLKKLPEVYLERVSQRFETPDDMFEQVPALGSRPTHENE